MRLAIANASANKIPEVRGSRGWSAPGKKSDTVSTSLSSALRHPSREQPGAEFLAPGGNNGIVVWVRFLRRIHAHKRVSFEFRLFIKFAQDFVCQIRVPGKFICAH